VTVVERFFYIRCGDSFASHHGKAVDDVEKPLDGGRLPLQAPPFSTTSLSFATSELQSNWVAMPTDPKAAYPLSRYDAAGKNGYAFAPWTSQ
jgi:hypothetical protein